MRVKAVVDEDFVNYKKPSMYVGTIRCSGKCCIEAGVPLSVCQNSEWQKAPIIDISNDKLIQRYMSNNITCAICFAGLEPFEQFNEMLEFIKVLREDYHCDDTVVIYTGYYESEVQNELEKLKKFPNLIVKFGRFIPDKPKHYDEILGVYLASPNQYAKRIS